LGFFSTFEKQLDAKRRIVVPQEFRAEAAGPFDGVFCFPSIEADCIEGGGQKLFEQYRGLIEEMPFGDPVRSALETSVYGGLCRLSFDTAGRITLPDSLCEMFGIQTDVAVVGLGEPFQIWPLEASAPSATRRARPRARPRRAPQPAAHTAQAGGPHDRPRPARPGAARRGGGGAGARAGRRESSTDVRRRGLQPRFVVAGRHGLAFDRDPAARRFADALAAGK
jgi:MraZ protein